MNKRKRKQDKEYKVKCYKCGVLIGSWKRKKNYPFGKKSKARNLYCCKYGCK